MKNKTIGILGGMGPAASVVTYQRLTYWAQKKYGAEQDYDYPPLVLYNLPIEEFGEDGDLSDEKILPQLISGVKVLEKAGSDFIIIACNTVHHYFNEMQSAINIPIISIVETAVAAVQNSGFKKIGVVCSEGTNKTKLYENSFLQNNINPTMPTGEQQKILNEIILKVMSGSHGQTEIEKILQIFEDYRNKNVEGIVLGCTELPLAIKQSDTDIKLFDTIDLICLKALELSYGE